MISSLSIWDGGHECSVHFHSFEKKKTLENKIYQASCCVWPVILMLFKAQTKDPKRSWFDFFYTVFFGNVCKCSLQKKNQRKKLRFIGS